MEWNKLEDKCHCHQVQIPYFSYLPSFNSENYKFIIKNQTINNNRACSYKYQTQLCILKTQKKFFDNNFCVHEHQTVKTVPQKETMFTQISAASPSPNVHSGKSYICLKNALFIFQRISANFLCEKKNWDRIMLSGQPLTYLIGK